jgi:dTMP kinase
VPFITLEGIEGSGKSTQSRRLADALGPATVLTREPGGTHLGRRVREVLLDHDQPTMVAPAELLLYFADRAQHVAEIIRPALEAGRTVVSDRYVESSVAYQGYGRGIDLALIQAVAYLATGGLRPDLIVFLDIPVPEGLARIERRGGRDRVEAERREFHERVRNGYLEMISAEPGRWVRVDGVGSADEVRVRIAAAVEARGQTVGDGLR